MKIKIITTFIFYLFLITVVVQISFAQNINTVFQYDNLNRLTRVDYGNGSIINYTYDANGNRLTEVIAGISLPAVPILSLPLNGAIGSQLFPFFDWSDVSTATGYRLQLSNSLAFTTILYDTAGLSLSQFNLSSNLLNPLTTYYWRVFASNIAGYGNSSEIWNFKTIGAPSAVTLTYPINNSVNEPVNINFSWRKAIDQTSLKSVSFIQDSKEPLVNLNKLAISKYSFEIATDSMFTNIVSRDSTLTDTNKTVSSLLNLTNYFWRVKAKNEVGWSSFSSWWKFTTIVSLPLAPSLITPTNNSTGNALNLNLVWNKPQFATGYNVILATDIGFTNIVLNDSLLSDSLKALSNLVPLSNYYWKVRAKNIAGWGTYSAIYTFRTIGTPNQVVLSTPINNATNQPIDITFKWSKAFDQVVDLLIDKSGKREISTDPLSVTNYWFELATDSSFINIVSRDSSLTDTNKTVSSLLNLTNYFWRVKAKNQIGWGAFSSGWKFTTIVSIPIAPVLSLPANNSTEVSLNPLLDWNDVQYSASYRIQVSVDSLFNITLWDTSGVVTSLVNIPANKLTGLTKYYWRVSASNVGGTGPYSVVWNFRTLQNLTLNLKVYLEGFWDGSSQVTDTTMVYLANTTTPFAFTDSAKVIISSTGSTVVNFTKTQNANYYIVVNHRNHLETWSKLPQSFVTNIAVNYDFTTAANKAYGDNMKQAGSVWVLYGGDANRDGAIDALDVPVFVTQFGNSGFLSCDFNGDGAVDALDVQIIVANFGLGKVVPTMDFQQPGNIKKQKVIEEIQKKFKLNGESEKKETLRKK